MRTQHPSYTDRLVTLFTARPGEYFDGLSLAKLAGAYAWRSRVSDARQQLKAHGLGDIVNTQRRRDDGTTCSLYRFVPSSPAGQQELFT